MTEIKPRLFVGGYRDALGDIPAWYELMGATHVLCVASEITPPEAHGIEIMHLPVADDDPSENIVQILPQALKFVKGALRDGGTVLIHCRSGASRAVCVTLAVLVDCYNFTLVDAFHYVARRRKVMNIFPEYLTQLEEWSHARTDSPA